MVRAIVFDLGGTLLDFNSQRRSWLDWEQSGLEGVYGCLTANGHDLPHALFVAYFVEALPRRWEEAARGGANLRLGELLRETCLACGVTLSTHEVERAVECYITPLDARVSMYDDAPATLETLRQRGHKIGLISNTMWPGEYHRRELERFGLLPFFDHTLFSADAGLWKPQPEVYRRVLAALGVPAAEAVFVGDAPRYDIAGAQAAGMRAIHKRHESFVPEGEPIVPDAEIRHLAELPALIEQW